MTYIITVNLNDLNVPNVRQELATQFAAHPNGEPFDLANDAHLFVGGSCERINRLIGESANLHLQGNIQVAVQRLQAVQHYFDECPEALFADWHVNDHTNGYRPWHIGSATAFQTLQRVCRIGNERRAGVMLSQLWQIDEALGENAAVARQQAANYTAVSDQILQQYVVDLLLVQEQINVLNAVYNYMGQARFRDLQYRHSQFSMLRYAVEAANPAVLTWLLQHLDPTLLATGDRWHSRCVLMQSAAKDGSVNILQILIAQAHTNNEDLIKVVWAAAQNDRVAVVEHLAATDNVTNVMLRQWRNRLRGHWAACLGTKHALNHLIAQAA